MDKLIIITDIKEPTGGHKISRIHAETYDTLSTLAKETGHSIPRLIAMCVGYALPRIELRNVSSIEESNNESL